MVEGGIDVILTLEFDIKNDESKVEFLTDRSFAQKMDFLKSKELFTSDEYAKIRAFQKERNDLFHYSEDFPQKILDTAHQKKVAEHGKAAISAVWNALSRRIEKTPEVQAMKLIFDRAFSEIQKSDKQN